MSPRSDSGTPDGTAEVQAAAEGAKLLLAVRGWIDQDPDQGDRDELRGLLELVQDPSSPEQRAQEAVADLAERFGGTLRFGTAGLRAQLGAGPMRMNRAVVRRAAAGVAAHVLEAAGPDPAPRAVIGFDARHRSADFARDTAAVLTAAGLSVELMPRPLPTPLLAWAVRSRGAEVGIMVTASHNPAADNGYKVYLGGRCVDAAGQGCQIVPPHDEQIAQRIEAVGDLRELPLADHGWTTLPEDIDRQYLEAAVGAAPGEASEPGLRIVLSAMHGVGGPTALAALQRAGFDDVHPVPEQFEPDPEFPTAPFPNPEEPGALSLSLSLAREVDADLVLANDPDADRCAVAVPDARDPRAVDGWRALTGDEVGALLGLAALRAADGASDRPIVANSIVSSRLLGRMAEAAGAAHRETLTGFKWIARVPGLVYGYEEALGYCVDPGTVRDKDGITATVGIARLARAAAADGRTLLDELDDLALRHGLHTASQLSIRVADLELIPAMMRALRESTPTELAGSPVVSVDDLSQPDPGSGLLPTEGMRLLTEDGTRVVVRPSGTEPKLKCYLETVAGVGSADRLPGARQAARERHDALTEQLRELFAA
ncbi:phospho-sugar mutase [Kocuria palustris]|uniref:phospho-sugar mutase n=1 Tax=Kocuria palustris TaxID=71999 RepID=UPI0011A77C05|nr:phospho-sugar mutase [Kocuria palustris]